MVQKFLQEFLQRHWYKKCQLEESSNEVPQGASATLSLLEWLATATTA